MSELKKNNWLKFNNIKKFIFVAAFFGFIAMPSIQMLTNFVTLNEVESFDEKRKLAKWEDIQISQVDSLISSFESYFKDNFGFRNHFISLNNRWKIRHFKVSPNKSVIVGKEGWYFLNANNSKEDHSGNRKFKTKELEELKENLLYKKEYIEKHGGKFYLVVLPDKMTVYSQYLPLSMQNSNGTRFDQFLAYFKGSQIDILDIRSALIDESKKKIVYQKTDSHWNHNGGFRAYQEIIKHLKKDFPSLNPYDINHFDIVKKTKHTGDLTTIVGVKNYEDNLRFYYNLKPNIYKGKAEFLEKYQGFSVSYQATFSYFNPTLKQPKLMVLNDSYINYIHAFFGNHFSESHYFWHQNFIEAQVDEIHPDIFIQMIVERSIEDIVKSDLK